MKCHLVNVVDNFHILITDAQYLGLMLFKKQFNGDLAVESQYNQWFRHGHSVVIPTQSFLDIVGLTYFAEIGDTKSTITEHIQSACDMATTNAKTGYKRVLKKSPIPQKKSPVPQKKSPLTKKKKKTERSLEESIEVILHSTNVKKQKIEIIDKIPESTVIPINELKKRLIVTADNSNHVTALTTWIMGTYAAHALFKTGAIAKIFTNGTFDLFSASDARDFFLAPWQYHPDTFAQIKEVIAVVKPINDKLVTALGTLDPSNVLHGLSSNDIFAAIVKGDTNVSPVSSETRKAIIDMMEHIGEPKIFQILKVSGAWSKERMLAMNPDRYLNLSKVYLHFDPSNMLTNISKMVLESISWKYLSDIYSDFTPHAMQESIDAVLVNNKLVADWVKVRARIGDDKTAVLRHKFVGSVSGIIISSCASIIAGIRTAGNIRDVAVESNKYRKGQNSNVKKAIIQTLLDGDNLYTLGNMLMVYSMEAVAVSAAVSLGDGFSSFAGSAPMTAYVGSLVLKELVQNAARKVGGLNETASVSVLNKSLALGIATAKFAGRITIKGTTMVSTKLAQTMFKLVGSKRSRDTEIGDAVKNYKKQMLIKDIEAGSNIRDKYWYNNNFRNHIITHMMIHI